MENDLEAPAGGDRAPDPRTHRAAERPPGHGGEEPEHAGRNRAGRGGRPAAARGASPASRTNLDRERSTQERLDAELAGMNQALEAAKSHLLDLMAREAQYRNVHQNASSNRENLKRRLKRIDEEEALAHQKIARGPGAREPGPARGSRRSRPRSSP
ncbi:MAG: hypothetical protein MZV70_67200 [Desulfobacterales bacterium]|nr:hypothetical protein [Desulfobacterales bacterium]